MSPTTRIVLFNFWEYVAFLANSLIFLLIGLKIDLRALMTEWTEILWAIGAVIAARVIVVYGLGWIADRLSEPISLRWRHILAWGGLRGALSLALALSVPAALGEESQLLLTMAFAVVLFTLLVQATTMRPLLSGLGILIRNPVQDEYEMRQAELAASRAAVLHMERRYREGLISANVWEVLKPRMQEQNALLARAVREFLQSEPSIENEEVEVARREILRAKRSAYLGLRRDGIISEEVFNQLTAQVDSAFDDAPILFALADADEPGDGSGGNEFGPVEMRELVVEAGSLSEDKRVRHVPWPDDFVISSIKRGSRTIVPRADTILRAGDVLTVTANAPGFKAARALCQTSNEIIE